VTIQISRYPAGKLEADYEIFYGWDTPGMSDIAPYNRAVLRWAIKNNLLTTIDAQDERSQERAGVFRELPQNGKKL
jgi:hypothetical protein